MFLYIPIWMFADDIVIFLGVDSESRQKKDESRQHVWDGDGQRGRENL